jgi:hypothetical protein
MPRRPRHAPGGISYHALRRVNQPQTTAELEALRRSVVRGRPFGSENWTRRLAKRLGLEFTLRPRGRPRKQRRPASPDAK